MNLEIYANIDQGKNIILEDAPFDYSGNLNFYIPKNIGTKFLIFIIMKNNGETDQINPLILNTILGNEIKRIELALDNTTKFVVNTETDINSNGVFIELEVLMTAGTFSVLTAEY